MALTNDSDVIEHITEFYRQYYSDEIAELAQNYPKEQRSLHVDWVDLFQFNPDLADDFLTNPAQMNEYAEEALRTYDLPIDVGLGRAHIRIYNIDEKISLTEIRARHLDRLISIQGTVEKTSTPSSQIIDAVFECQRCGTRIRVPQSIRGKKKEPYQCPGCERKGPYQVNRDQSEYIDYQTITLREQISGVGTTDDIETIVCDLRGDLAGTVDVGDHLELTGILIPEPMGESNDGSLSDKYLHVNSIAQREPAYDLTITDEDVQSFQKLANDEDIYRKMVASVAPSIYGHKITKLALLMQLFSGVAKILPDGTRIRGDIHVLLIGDPGVGKSRLLRKASQLAPRAVYLSGKNTTSAGLVGAAVRTSSGNTPWELEAGALVLANHGVACLDGLDNMHPEDRTALSDVLEHQEIHVSKASVTDTIEAKTSVLCAANPKYGRFDQYESIGEQLDLEPGIISQFDLIFPLVDRPHSDHDEALAEHILSANQIGEQAAAGEIPEDTTDIDPAIDSTCLRKYIAYANRTVTPVIDESAREVIKEFYVSLRSNTDEDRPIPVTARKLEAIVRLTEASARMRLSDTATKIDAERVVTLIKSCLADLGINMAPDNDGDDSDGSMRVSTSYREQKKSENEVKNIISEEEAQAEEGAPVDTVLDRCEQLGIDRSKAEHLIDSLKQKGEVYEPRTDHLRTT